MIKEINIDELVENLGLTNIEKFKLAKRLLVQIVLDDHDTSRAGKLDEIVKQLNKF